LNILFLREFRDQIGFIHRFSLQKNRPKFTFRPLTAGRSEGAYGKRLSDWSEKSTGILRIAPAPRRGERLEVRGEGKSLEMLINFPLASFGLFPYTTTI
jgi:hypothetical protein